MKILYPYHPLFGTDYEVFGFALGERDMVYIRLPDQSTRGVPAWMFDPGICAVVRLADKPLIDAHALMSLGQLLDSARPAEGNLGHEPTTVKEQD